VATPLPRDGLFMRLAAPREWDLAVVGGGAVGLGVASDAVARGFSVVLLEAADARGALAARIGTAQERIANATTRNSAEATALQIARIGIVSADPYEAATALTEAESQLDTLYAVTARLSRLSLANYL
jgi:flagellar hook-associated protein 3 FlgL